MTYRNPWAAQGQCDTIEARAEPVEHAGCQIFRALPTQWDVVKGGVCIAQRAGKSGAMRCAEVVADLLFPSFEDVRERILAVEGHY